VLRDPDFDQAIGRSRRESDRPRILQLASGMQQKQPRARIAGDDIGDVAPLDSGAGRHRSLLQRLDDRVQRGVILRVAGRPVHLSEREPDSGQAGVEAGLLFGGQLRDQLVGAGPRIGEVLGFSGRVMQLEQE
jgi:hypothetical protein